jgi:hypothetical protein
MKDSIWYPTKDNYSAFDAAISKNISITASLGRFELNDFAY